MITIYGKPTCRYCDMARKLCETRGVEYTYYSIGTDCTQEEFSNVFPEARTVPQIIVDGEKIGGFDGFGAYLDKVNYQG